MKILQSVHLFYPDIGGIEIHTYNLAKELVKLGNDVEVFTARTGDLKDRENVNGIRVRRFFSIPLPMFSSVRFSPNMFFAMLKSDAYVYCSHGYGSLMPFFTALAAWLRRKPFIFTLHGYPKLKGFGGLFQSLYRALFASIFLRIAKKIVVVSKASIKDIENEVDRKKIVYISNGIDTRRFNCDRGFVNNNTLKYIGRLDSYKGIDTLIRAFAELSKKNDWLRLDIVGKDEGIKKELSRLIEELDLVDKVEFRQAKYDNVQKEYCGALAIILPSKYEGFSLTWLEAMASERPIFSTSVGDAEFLFSTVFKKDKKLFLFKGEKDLLNKLIYFLKNKRYIEKILKKGRAEVVKKFSWKNIAKETVDAYKSDL